MNIQTVSVKVMRSHDYCHFEVALSATVESTDNNAQAITSTDELRKTAARLADKAVDQYRIAKIAHSRRASERRDRLWEGKRVKSLEEKPESERTPEEQARIKAYRDQLFEEGREYDYQDDWQQDESDE
jgi:hypothetical protein